MEGNMRAEYIESLGPVAGNCWRLVDDEADGDEIIIDRAALPASVTTAEAALIALTAMADEIANPPSITAAEARYRVMAAIEAAQAPILDAYPPGERLGWDAKAQEAATVLTAGESATLDLAPLLVAECAAEYGEADGATRLTQLAAKAGAVAAKAAAWGALMATLSGIRGKAFAAIDAAEDEAELQAALDAALAAITSSAAP